MTTRRTFLRLLGIGAPAAALGATAKPQVVSGFPSEANNSARREFIPYTDDRPLWNYEEHFDGEVFQIYKPNKQG